MKIITEGEVKNKDGTTFRSVLQVDQSVAYLTFTGKITLEHPYEVLAHHIDELKHKISNIGAQKVMIDFCGLQDVTPNGFYTIMHLVNLVYEQCQAPIIVVKEANNAWQEDLVLKVIQNEQIQIKNRTEMVEKSNEQGSL